MSADKKKPTGDSTHPAGCTDSADFTSSIVKTAIISFVVGLAISSCSPAYAGAGHRNQMQPNQPQTHAQQAQAASKSVASKGGRHE